jgi:MoaA/NifB/PqqE/SkfB family radical SAM enzyme
MYIKLFVSEFKKNDINVSGGSMSNSYFEGQKPMKQQNDMIAIASQMHSLMHCTIELLTKCNWRCRHCYIAHHSSAGLPFECLYDLFRQLRELKTFELVLTGGEIFMRNDIMKIIKICRLAGFNLQLFTNVALITSEQLDDLSVLSIEKISCTLFSLDNKIHDSISMINGSCEKTKHNIIEMRKRKINVEVKMIVMKPNINSIADMIDFCDKYSCQFLATTNVFPKSDGSNVSNDLCLSDKDLDIVLPIIDPIRDFDKPRKISEDNYICNQIRHSLYINAQGKVFPCNMLPVEIGDITENYISDIWHNSTLLKSISDIRW